MNWIVRMKNKQFWIAIIPAALLLIQQIAGIFGYVMEFGTLSDELLAVINTIFMVLAILGIVNDPTTAGIGDSELAKTYNRPKEKIKK